MRELVRDIHEVKEILLVRSTLSRIETDVKDIKDIKDIKFSLSSFIEEKFRKQELEVTEIKATLARILEKG